MALRVEKLSHYGPSLSVKFYGDYVFAGYGLCIQVYDVFSGKLVNECQIFHRNKVHGISIKNGNVLAYGARSVSIVSIETLLKSKCQLMCEKLSPEWITSAEFSFDGNTAFLLTCYNKVLCCDLELEILETKAVYGERSILYSGTITVRSAEKVHINAGTVMDGVLIWDLFSEKNLHHFTGHEGSIFYVTASQNGRYVASCSDDRSIKLWDLKSGSLLSTGWGHTARIWNLQFFDGDTKLISASEDCTCRVWKVCQETGQLTQQEVHEVHLSKSVWGLDVDSDRMIAATSGNDGRIKLTDLKLLNRIGDETQSFSIEDISLHDVNFSSKEIIKGFFWLHFGLVAITSEGKIIKFNHRNATWSQVLSNHKFQDFSLTTGVQEFNLVIFANGVGDLFVVKFSDDDEEVIETLETTVPGLSKVTNCLVDSVEGDLLVLLQSPNPNDSLVCLKVNSNCLKILETYSFQRPPNFSANCMLHHNNFLLLGSKFSTLAIFCLADTEKRPHVLSRLLPGDTITSLKYVEQSSDGKCLFSVTDRDGFYCFASIDLDAGDAETVLNNKTSKRFLEGAFYDSNGDYITYGFKSNYFVVYNETQQFEIMNELCGGSHRQWTFLPNFGLDEYVFAYVKASRINIRKLHKPTFPLLLRNGLHGREMRDVSLHPGLYGKGKKVFCTGSEDTTVKLNSVDESGATRAIWTFRKHTSGLQRCKFVSNELFITSAAREELYVWKVSSEFKSNPYMKAIATLPPSTKLPDLRIMDFDVQFFGNSKNFIMVTVYSDSAIKLWYFDQESEHFTLIGEGKYETCCLLNVKLLLLKDVLLLIVSPSDGHLVVWDITLSLPFSVRKGKLEDLFSGVSAVSALPTYSTRFPVHRAGIKFLEAKKINESSCVLYSGGDDNAVAISEIKVSEVGRAITGHVLSFDETAAASTVTAACLIDDGSMLVIASVDQRLKCYDVTDHSLKLKDVMYTTNADTGCLDATSTPNGTLLLVGGVGFSAWRLNLAQR
ncbi:LAFA_0C02784g1_1 [Lachancea sp. 'fantastica']|nr:LAFA_0C02784g1_1 [Lachancea sp. 'fantastica']